MWKTEDGKIWCFYHGADLDGKCSGALVAIHHNWNVELRPINYTDKFPWNEIQPNDVVYMVDFGLQPFEDMIKLNSMCHLIWIDHHITAIQNYDAYMETEDAVGIAGLRDLKFAGCELTWKYLNGGVDFDPHMPKPVYLMGRYDIWKWQDIPHALPFQYGMKLYKDTHPKNRDLWESLIIEEDDYIIKDIINNGERLLEYQRNLDASACRIMAFETEFEGLKAIAMNRMPAGSQLFDSVWDTDKYDCMIAFARTDGKWNVSMYTDKDGINVGEVCKKHGGGGHVGAAGFSCEVLPFKH